VPRFVLLDHSLSDYVGHHYAYAKLLLTAARAEGFHPVLAANRRMRSLGPEFPEVEVHRLFRYSTYCRYTYDALHPLGRRTAGGALTRVARARRSRSFAAACAALARKVPLEEDDVVFAATMSELDFSGLARWLAADPNTRRARWHVQFHVNLFRGREPDYPSQHSVAGAVREVLGRALAPLHGHRLRLYCTTAPLARQYDGLGVGRFEVLPYPVDEAFWRPNRSIGNGAPLRVALAGHSRREKGHAHLPGLVRELWDRHLSTGRVQLVVQSRAGKVRLTLPPGAAPDVEPVVFAPAGLPQERYVELVRGADVGLLPYDADRYYTRCSGVLLEMLCAGVPVLVPAGTWLAEQIAEPIQRHLDGLAASAGPKLPRRTTHGEAARPLAEPTPDHAGARFDLDIPPSVSDLLVSFTWPEPREPGVYIRVETRQLDAREAEIGTTADVVGQRERSLPVRALVRVVDGARSLRLVLRDAFGDSTPALEHLSVQPIVPGGSSPAAGAVGLIAAEPAREPALVRELIEHHSHYRRTATSFAVACRERHTAAEVLRRLLED